MIDTKRHKGKVEITTPLFGSAKLKIAGRDCTGLVAGLADQVQVVRASGAVPKGVPVRGRFCFVEAELPWLGRTIAGLELMHRKSLARALNKPGELNEAAVDSIAAALVTAFPRRRAQGVGASRRKLSQPCRALQARVGIGAGVERPDAGSGHVPRVGVGGGRTERRSSGHRGAHDRRTSQGSTKGGRRWPVRTG